MNNKIYLFNTYNFNYYQLILFFFYFLICNNRFEKVENMNNLKTYN